jgi:RNA polymerase sporulation-specific sigma factor
MAAVESFKCQGAIDKSDFMAAYLDAIGHYAAKHKSFPPSDGAAQWEMRCVIRAAQWGMSHRLYYAKGERPKRRHGITLVAFDEILHDRVAPSSAEPCEAEDNATITASLGRVLSGLSKSDRAFVDYHYFKGLPQTQSAAKSGLPVTTITAHRRRILSALRAALGEDFRRNL